MFQRFRKFLKTETGAVTVDWVVLCALLVAFAWAMSQQMGGGTLELTSDVDTYLNNKDPN